MLSSTAMREPEPGSREVTSSASPQPPANGLPEQVAGAAYDVAYRLMDSLLHDARNPLNALAINLEVLAEKLKDDDGKVPESQDKNIRAMRDQIFRVDAILRQFCEFLAPKPGRGEVNLSELCTRAVEVVGHESRRRRVKLKVAIEPNLSLKSADPSFLHLATVQLLLRGLLRCEAGAEVSVALHHHGPDAIFTVSDPSPEAGPNAGSQADPMPHAISAVRHLAQQNDARLAVSGGTVQLTLTTRT